MSVTHSRKNNLLRCYYHYYYKKNSFIKRKFVHLNSTFSASLSAHDAHIPCTPIPKDAKNYGLQDCLDDLVLVSHDCCGFGPRVPLYFFIAWCSSKPFRPSPSSSFALLPLVSLLPKYLLPSYCPYMPSTHAPCTTLFIIIWVAIDHFLVFGPLRATATPWAFLADSSP